MTIFDADLTVWTIWVALLLYAVAVILMLHAAPSSPWPRRYWTGAWLVYLSHVIAAFAFHHDWSHAEAVEHVDRESGFGDGIFVSYFFTLAWTLDVAWWWLRPSSYSHRSRWLGVALHSFFLFMIFNATVVFETGLSRVAGIVLMGVVGVSWLLSLRDLSR